MDIKDIYCRMRRGPKTKAWDFPILMAWIKEIKLTKTNSQWNGGKPRMCITEVKGVHI